MRWLEVVIIAMIALILGCFAVNIVLSAPEIGAVLATLRDEPEVLLARVSGSGGTCFALCPDDISAETLAERIEAVAPTWWVRRCRLGGPWA